jgi:hypothetical protein
MSQNNVVSSGPIRQWGERTMPIVTRKAYVFSLDLAFELDLQRVGRVRNAMFVSLQNPLRNAKPPPNAKTKILSCGQTYHVQDEVLVKTADGVIRDVPRGKIRRSNEWVSIDDAGMGSVDGRALLALDVNTYVSIEYSGVIWLNGNVLRLLTQQSTDALDLDASTFISVRSQCEQPKYRWLVENQLFAFGRMHVTQPAWGSPKDWKCTLSFSYDVYSMGGG